MSNLNNRVKKLESASDALEPIHIMLTYVDPGSIEPIGYRCGEVNNVNVMSRIEGDSAPIGYRCGEVEIIREPDESEEDFKTRCHDSVVWPFGNSCHSFHPMYANGEVTGRIAAGNSSQSFDPIYADAQ